MMDTGRPTIDEIRQAIDFWARLFRQPMQSMASSRKRIMAQLRNFPPTGFSKPGNVQRRGARLKP